MIGGQSSTRSWTWCARSGSDTTSPSSKDSSTSGTTMERGSGTASTTTFSPGGWTTRGHKPSKSSPASAMRPAYIQHPTHTTAHDAREPALVVTHYRPGPEERAAFQLQRDAGNERSRKAPRGSHTRTTDGVLWSHRTSPNQNSTRNVLMLKGFYEG